MYSMTKEESEKLKGLLMDAYDLIVSQGSPRKNDLTVEEIAGLHVKIAEIVYQCPELVNSLNLASVGRKSYEREARSLIPNFNMYSFSTLRYLWGIRTDRHGDFVDPLSGISATTNPEVEGRAFFTPSCLEIAKVLYEHPFYAENANHPLPYSYALALDIDKAS